MNINLRRYIFRFIIFVPLAWLLIILVLLQSNETTNSSLNQVHRNGRDADVADAFGGDPFQPVGDHVVPNQVNTSISKAQSSELVRLIHDKPEQVAAPQLDNAKQNLDGPGEMGKGFDVDKTKLTPDELRKYDEGFQKNAFNGYVSDLISIHRSLPDVRDPGCRKIAYTAVSVTASVVMCFHNEAWSVLLRSIHSILDRTPPNLLKEIIIVDDFSDMGNEQSCLTTMAQLVSFVYFLHFRLIC
jgi:hypothetical protein